MSDTIDEPSKTQEKINIENRCEGTTKVGKKCMKKPVKDRKYCNIHKHLFSYSKPEECPICTDSLDGEHQPLSCGHWVHKNCIVKWKDQCPICKRKIKLTKKELSKCPENENKDENDDVDEVYFYLYVLT